jgi:parvulin-like peptidyl-prolyl isomerase
MTEEKEAVGIAKRALLHLLLLVVMGWFPVANAETVVSLGDVGLDADAVMRLLEQTDDAAPELTEQQQRDLIFQNLLSKYLAKQAEEVGLHEQPAVAERIRVLAEESQLYNAYLRSLVPVTGLTTAQVVRLYRENLQQFQRPESVSVNQIVVTPAVYGEDFESVVSKLQTTLQAKGGEAFDVNSDLGLGDEVQKNAALERTVAVADLLPSVREALAAADVGQAVGPIAVAQGVAFIRLNQRLSAGSRALEEVEDLIRDRASTALRNSLETAYVEELVQANPIKLRGERSWAGWLEGKRLPRRPEKRVIAEMGAVEYSLGELLAFIEVLKTTGVTQQQLSEPEYLREQVVKARVVRKLLIEQAKASGFDGQLKVKAMVAEARRMILADARLAQIIDGAVTAPEQAVIEDYYQRNIADYRQPGGVNISQLLIGAGEGAEAAAAEFVRSIQSGESSFRARAQELSDEGGAVAATLTEGWVALSDIPANVFEQIKEMSSGDLSAPISVAEGFLVIRINEVRRARIIPLEQIRERVAAEYVSRQRSAEQIRIVSELRKAQKY